MLAQLGDQLHVQQVEWTETVRTTRKARVEKHFTWDKVAQRVVDGYHRVL